MKKNRLKKPDFDQTIKKVETISSKVDIIMRNRVIIAFFLIVDGITFILNPDTTLPEMAKNIILLILLATFSVLITNLAAKAKDIKTIVISLIILALGAVFYFYPDLIAAYMQLLLALFIIYNGTMNIAKALKFDDKLAKYAASITKKYQKLSSKKSKKSKNEAKTNQREKFKEVDTNINTGLEEQKEKLVSPLRNIVNKTSEHRVLYIVANSASIILGIVLLVYPGASMTMWGIIFIYTGLPNLFAAAKDMELFKKIKEKRFKEILFDAESPQEKEQAKSQEPSQK